MDFRKIVRNQSLMSGILLVLLGIMFLLTPAYALSNVVRIGGWFLVISGIMGIISSLKFGLDSRIIGPVLVLLVGIWFIRSPYSVISYVNILCGIILLISSISALIQGGRRSTAQTLLVIAGIVFGVMILLDPFRLTNIIVRLVGVALIYQGAVNLSFIKALR